MCFASWSLFRLWATNNFLRWRYKWLSLDAGSGPYARCLKISRLKCLSYVQVAACSHAFLEQQTLFPQITFFYCTFVPSPYTATIYLWILVGWTFLAFKNPITHHPSRVAGFCSTPLTTKIWGKHIWHCYTQYTYRRWKEVHVSSAHPLCAISSYFLDMPHTLKKCRRFGIKSLQAGSLQGTYVQYNRLFRQTGNVRLAQFQVYALTQMRSVLFWDFPQGRM